MAIAAERELDLVEIAPQVRPPVARILDFGKFQYQQEKTERKQRAKQKRVEIKSIRLSLKIGRHDLETRRSQAERFLNEHHKVKLEMFLRGREKRHLNLAQKIMMNFIHDLGEKMIIEQPLDRQGGKLFCLIARKS